MWRVAENAVRTLRENIEVVEVDAGGTMMMLDDDDDDDDAGGFVGVHQGENSTLLTTSVVDDDFEGETEEEEEEETEEGRGVRSDLRRVATKIKPIAPYAVLFSVAFLSVHWMMVSVMLVLFGWHLKTNESVVAEIAKKEGFIRRNVLRDLLHCASMSYVFLFVVQTKLDEENVVDGSPKMWRRATLKTPTRSNFTAWEAVFEIVAVNLNARLMFDALKCVCMLTTTTTSGILGNAAYVAKIVSELDGKSAKKFVSDGFRRIAPNSVTKIVFGKKEKDDKDEDVGLANEASMGAEEQQQQRRQSVVDIESGGGATLVVLENDREQVGGKDSRRPYRARGLAISAIEYASISYKIILPVPIWFAFFQNASLYGLFLSSALAGSYLACAFFKTSKSIREFKQAFLRRYNFGSKAFSCAHGTPATKADIENLGLEFECAICQEKEIIAPLKLECNHVFCEECVEPWFEKDNTTCPLCRAVVVEKRKDELKSLSSGETHFLPVIF
mmetsp:Transcript_9495/g.27366  ORF Transcript_9495/g.27366 Transcript_9495/m.27366 type:complete len:501 (+) Transcript_9495:28-1530(+)